MATSNIPGLQEALARLADPNATSGSESPEGVREFKTLPFDREFHVTVSASKYTTSSNGNPGIRMEYDVTDPEFEGSKIWDSLYFTGHTFQGERLATLVSAAANDHPVDFDGDIEPVAPQLVGAKLIVALKPNDQNPQYPQVRWLARDIGQQAKTGLKPVKPKAAKAVETAPTVLPGMGEAPAGTGVSAAPQAPGGIKLPGMG